MSIQIKTPNITAGNDRERLQQIQSYLYQMAQQLQWAFDTLEKGGSGLSGTSAIVGAVSNGQSVAPKVDFAGIKELIIKSADIVNAYTAQISKRLEGQYVAQSDFGTYSEKTAQDIQANSTSINQLFSNYQTIAETQLSTNAYIRTGLLGYQVETAQPIYGLEIGQQDSQAGQTMFKKFARFTSDKLSFYDSNDTEVAYVSDYRLYITNVSITGALFLMDEFEVSKGNGTIDFRWLGG